MTHFQKAQVCSEAYEQVSRTRHELQLAGILSDDLAESLKEVLSKLAQLEDQLGAPQQLHR